jgi:hypothetical protein
MEVSRIGLPFSGVCAEGTATENGLDDVLETKAGFVDNSAGSNVVRFVVEE